ncbi:MAG: spore cortex-lytic enzyme [Clostridia bacterium]|nr:spore cortex-lytic enzyme [Clostridia bacterium]MBR2413564.1 spore cortex-lytic enzyme [Clostridia bacterium]MBR3955904.1 spore cortex-lytic enzyme [Clostridia bacterium]
MKLKLTRYGKIIAFLTAAVLLCGSCVFAKSDYFLLYNEKNNTQVLSKYGSRGEEVRKIQNKLKELGYYTGSVDGIFGTKTQSAVKAFQRNCGLTVDGIAGPKTLLYLGLGGSSSSSGSYSSNDVYLLAKLIAAEARGESYTGQVAVGAVVLNRVEHGSFPDSISGVVYQAGAFSAVKDSNWSVSPNATAQKAARDAINGWDPSGGAIYYYNPKTAKSQWIRSRPIIAVIGNHVFCS